LKAMKRKNLVLAALTGFGILTAVLFLTFGRGMSELCAQLFLTAVILASTAAAGFWLRGQSKLKIARLIAENPILRIRTAVISELSGKTVRQPETEDGEVVVSYFGILLGKKIIKFNQDGIRLRTLEIEDDYLSFTCGTERRTQNIRLLRPAIEAAELAKLAERFRYETGITPTFLARESEGEAPLIKSQSLCAEKSI
jgi:hypothetical protein